MSAEDIVCLLKQWGYSEEVVQKFTDEGIKPKHLVNISEFTLKELFPKAGDRLDFIEHISRFKTEKEKTTVPDVIDLNSNILIFDEDGTMIGSDSVAGTSDTSDRPEEVIQGVNTSLVPGTSGISNKRPRLHREQDLKALLEGTPEGKIIVATSRSADKMTDTLRQKLGDEIIRAELQDDVEKSFPNERIDMWTAKIMDLFPGERYVREIWAGCTQGKLRSTVAGRGILLARYYNMRRKLLKSGVIRKSARVTEKEESMDFDDPDSEEVEDAMQWLRNNARSVTSSLQKWQLTSHSRVRALQQSEKTVQQYFDEFSVLKSSDAATLIEMDFEIHYPAAALKLFTEWPYLSSFILSRVSLAEKESVQDCFTSDGKKAKTLRLLHSLFNVRTVYCKGRKQWRPSRLESRNALIQFTKSEGDVLTSLHEKRQKYKELGLTHSPQAVLVSRDEDLIDSCYVIINQVVLNVDSPLKAVDVAFKCMHMLDTEFPRECSREFLFLQLAVYEFTTKGDKKYLDKKTQTLIDEYKKYKSDN